MPLEIDEESGKKFNKRLYPVIKFVKIYVGYMNSQIHTLLLSPILSKYLLLHSNSPVIYF